MLLTSLLLLLLFACRPICLRKQTIKQTINSRISASLIANMMSNDMQTLSIVCSPLAQQPLSIRARLRANFNKPNRLMRPHTRRRNREFARRDGTIPVACLWRRARLAKKPDSRAARVARHAQRKNAVSERRRLAARSRVPPLPPPPPSSFIAAHFGERSIIAVFYFLFVCCFCRRKNGRSTRVDSQVRRRCAVCE